MKHRNLPIHRNDAQKPVDTYTRQYLDTAYFAKLDNINYPNPKLVVVFSGSNAVGKSTLAQKIKTELHALVLENDDLRRFLFNAFQDKSREEINQLMWHYSLSEYQRLDTLTINGLVVRDAVIDWYHDQILPIFENAGYTIFIVAFETSRSKAEELVTARGDTPTVKAQSLLRMIDDHAMYIQRFRSAYTPDVILSGEDLFNHELVITALRDRLSGKL